jgi:hypothetical protein
VFFREKLQRGVALPDLSADLAASQFLTEGEPSADGEEVAVDDSAPF